MMHKRCLESSELRDWLRLTRTENVGPVTFRQLLLRYRTAKAALEALPELAKRGGSKRVLVAPALASIDDEIKALEKLGGRFIATCEPDYPEAVAAIEDAPPILSVLGNVRVLHKRQIGIVGARNASLNGRKMAEKLARDLGQNGFVIASGLARGIDTAAHQASLDTGTVAVIAGGVDVVYPEENRVLYHKIMETGCIISDQPLSCQPQARLFPKRNRLISGLSLGVIVVEAALQSGSLITARMALEQGREVFAVPGSPLDPRANGTNDLLRQGAVLTENVTDVLNHIHSMPQSLCEPPHGFDDNAPMLDDENLLAEARVIILETLSPSPVAIDEIIRDSGLPTTAVLSVLLELELAGRVERQAGQKVALVG